MNMNAIDREEIYLRRIGNAEYEVSCICERADEDGYPDVATAADKLLGDLDALRTILRDYWEEGDKPDTYYPLSLPPR